MGYRITKGRSPRTRMVRHLNGKVERSRQTAGQGFHATATTQNVNRRIQMSAVIRRDNKVGITRNVSDMGPVIHHEAVQHSTGIVVRVTVKVIMRKYVGIK